jgi:hypothetical protein
LKSANYRLVGSFGNLVRGLSIIKLKVITQIHSTTPHQHHQGDWSTNNGLGVIINRIRDLFAMILLQAALKPNCSAGGSSQSIV